MKPDIYCLVSVTFEFMRAARALDMLLILQRRGRSSARELAAELEVSERTVLRDVQVLGEAGVPIFTTQGAQGGIELLDGFETNLTGLTSDEALTLFLVGQPRIAHRLGLGAPAKTARRKLVASLPKSLVVEADALSGWFIHDPDPWAGHNIPHGELRRIGSCIRRRRRIELTMDTDPDPVMFAPAGLVLKAGSWIMIHLEKGQPQVLPLDGLRTTRITNRAFSIPSGFSLEEFWEAHASLP